MARFGEPVQRHPGQTVRIRVDLTGFTADDHGAVLETTVVALADAKVDKIADLKGKRVFIRVDFNVPIKDGRIGDDTRLRGSVPTIQYALEAGEVLVVGGGLGM